MNDYVSVTEYARIKQKDPSHVRRLLIEGKLKGEKIGNQWVINRYTDYPKDLRITTGKYRNWRERKELNKHHDLMSSIKKMNKELINIYGDLVYEIILYGSYARGDQTEDSDVDIAVILLDKPTKEMDKASISCVARYDIECNKVLSVLDIDYNKYNKLLGSLPFYNNIEKEGIVLWKKK